MHKTHIALAAGLAVVSACIYRKRVRPPKRVPTYRASGPEPQILASLPVEPANLYYLTKPPWLVVPVRPFRSDNREFPKRHRWRDPQGPLADVYNPNMVKGH